VNHVGNSAIASDFAERPLPSSPVAGAPGPAPSQPAAGTSSSASRSDLAGKSAQPRLAAAPSEAWGEPHPDDVASSDGDAIKASDAHRIATVNQPDQSAGADPSGSVAASGRMRCVAGEAG